MRAIALKLSPLRQLLVGSAAAVFVLTASAAIPTADAKHHVPKPSPTAAPSATTGAQLVPDGES